MATKSAVTGAQDISDIARSTTQIWRGGGYGTRNEVLITHVVIIELGGIQVRRHCVHSTCNLESDSR